MTTHSSKKILSIARDLKRPTSLDYINEITTDFFELGGDRRFGNDPSIVAGVGLIDDHPFTIIGQQRGKSINENKIRNNGMNLPSGYHKAIRIMKLSEQFNRPVLTLVDTKGAYPGKNAEELNQNFAISQSISTMLNLKVPIISIIIGEGGSGGALALALGNELIMLQNSIFSVVSPEGASTILWKDTERIDEAVNSLKITSNDLFNLGVIDTILPEINSLDNKINLQEQSEIIKKYIMIKTKQLKKLSGEELKNIRIDKYRNLC